MSGFIPIFMSSGHNYQVGDRFEIAAATYEVCTVVNRYSLVLRRLGFWEILGERLRRCWPFRFHGFWARVWTR